MYMFFAQNAKLMQNAKGVSVHPHVSSLILLDRFRCNLVLRDLH